MMAYIRKLHTECNRAFCRVRASYDVFGNRNQRIGSYCKKHAEIQKQIQQEIEKMEWQEAHNDTNN